MQRLPKFKCTILDANQFEKLMIDAGYSISGTAPAQVQREQGTGNFLTGKTHVFKHEIEIMTRSLSGVEVLFFSGYASCKNIFFLTEALNWCK
jgi:hypothetical protein